MPDPKTMAAELRRAARVLRRLGEHAVARSCATRARKLSAGWTLERLAAAGDTGAAAVLAACS